MSKFYSTVDSLNGRGLLTKTGGSNGIKASVQSWEGSVITRLFEKDGELSVSVGFCDGSGTQEDFSYPHFEGTYKDLKRAIEIGSKILAKEKAEKPLDKGFSLK